MQISDLEHDLKMQLARELCAILDGYPRELAAAYIGTLGSELSRIRNGDLRRFSLTRIIRFVARTGHDIEIHLNRTPRLEECPKPRHQPASTVQRYDFYGRLVDSK
jgi:Helix-turn-helix domain